MSDKYIKIFKFWNNLEILIEFKLSAQEQKAQGAKRKLSADESL